MPGLNIATPSNTAKTDPLRFIPVRVPLMKEEALMFYIAKIK